MAHYANFAPWGEYINSSVIQAGRYEYQTQWKDCEDYAMNKFCTMAIPFDLYDWDQQHQDIVKSSCVIDTKTGITLRQFGYRNEKYKMKAPCCENRQETYVEIVEWQGGDKTTYYYQSLSDAAKGHENSMTYEELDSIVKSDVYTPNGDHIFSGKRR